MQPQEDKLRNIKEAAERVGLTEPSFRHVFYNINQKQWPKPTYVGKRFQVKKNINGITREFECKSLLKFSEANLAAFVSGDRA